MNRSADRPPGHLIAEAICQTLESPNENDRNLEAANVVDGLFAIARALNRIANSNEAQPAPPPVPRYWCDTCGRVSVDQFGSACPQCQARAMNPPALGFDKHRYKRHLGRSLCAICDGGPLHAIHDPAGLYPIPRDGGKNLA